MKKTVLVVATLIVAGSVAFIAISDKPGQKPVPKTTASDGNKQNVVDTAKKIEESALSGTVEVIYEEGGFTPSSITIAKGTAINFINKTQIPLWVASDPHPEHTNYPGFDVSFQGSVPEPGQNASFTFDKAGTWTYHNHSAPEDKATVIVK